MSRRAWIYIGAVLAAGVVLSVLALADISHASPSLVLFVLVLAATIAQLNKVEAPNHSIFHATPIFFVAGVLLLAPPQLVLLIIVPHLCEWARERWRKSLHLRAWYIQPFNISKHLIAAFAAQILYVKLTAEFPASGSFPVLALPIVVIAYVSLNQILLGQALVFARQANWHASGVFDIDSVLPEVVMACIGVSAALLWRVSPWLLGLPLAPLVLMYRALLIPKLKQDAQIDAKTGLANHGHFNSLFSIELERAIRFSRPMSVVMADLDYLRTINNTFGHLTGDIVLTGVAQLIKQQVRDCDIVGRFGGEEFSIVLVEATREEACRVAERVRHAIEAARFVDPTTANIVTATMSFGIASYPLDGATPTALTRAADVAVYQAKAQGRNRVVSVADVPRQLLADHILEASQWETRPGLASAASETAPAPAAPPILPAPARPTAPPVLPTFAPPADGPVRIKTAQPTAPGSIPADLDAAQAHSRRRKDRTVMPPSAWIYIALILAAGLCGSGAALWQLAPAALLQPLFGVLLACATLAQLYRIDGPNHELFHPAPVFLFAGVILLPAPLFVLLVIIPHLLEWAKERWMHSPHLRDWYLQPFNMAMYIIAGLIAQRVVVLLGSTGQPQLNTDPLIALGCGLAFSMINQLILGVVLWLARGINLRESNVLTSGFVTEGVLACLGFAVALFWQANPWLLFLALAPLVLIYQAFSIPKLQAQNMRALQQLNVELTHANAAIQQFNDELFLTLAKIFDARDPYVGGHAAQVAIYATTIAEELGLPTGRVELIRQAAYLHDIGKIAIPEAILHKPAKLTNDEFEIVKAHATLGAEFLETSQSLRHLAPFVRHHHERWDGSGYPVGLKSDEIPLEARILNVCDSVEAMASDRPYHTGMSVEGIIAEIRRCSGHQFDPTIAEIFIRIAEREGQRFVVNSARVVDQKHADPATLAVSSSGLIFARLYNQATA